MLGSRHTHREMVHHRGKDGAPIVGRMRRKAADGRSDGQAIKNGNIGKPSTYNYNGWIGEQADLWGDRLSSREIRSHNCQANGEKSSGWGCPDGQAIKYGNIEKPSTDSYND